MPKSALIVTWNKGSKSGKLLREKLVEEGVTCYVRSKEYAASINPSLVAKSLCINWGTSAILVGLNSKAPFFSNKLNFFKHAYANSLTAYVPKYFTNKPAAAEFLENYPKNALVGRSILNGSSGNGIVLLDKDTIHNYPELPLYTVYIPKLSEYRVHFFKSPNSIKFWNQKKKALKAYPETPDRYKIRNMNRGWVFSSQNFVMEDYVTSVAKKFADKLPLDFGALDIIYNEKEHSAYALEVNTAPGLSEMTASWYSQNIKNYIEEIS